MITGTFIEFLSCDWSLCITIVANLLIKLILQRISEKSQQQTQKDQWKPQNTAFSVSSQSFVFEPQF